MLAAERKRGQASIGIGANLATAYQNYSVASYQWNASWFAMFVDQAAAAGVVELSVFPAGMTDLSTAGVDAFFLDSLRRFLAHKTPQVIPPVPSLFTLLRPYLAHFPPVFSRFLRVFTVSPRRFQRAPSRNPEPRDRRQGGEGT